LELIANPKKGIHIMAIATLGIDIAKNIFYVTGMDKRGA